MKKRGNIFNTSKITTYEIRIKGVLDRKWADWFGTFNISPLANGETILIGQVTDQSALRGIVSQILNLNLELISVVKIEDKGEIKVK